MNLKELSLPLFLEKIPAGFPSPADGYLDQALDLNQYLIKNPPTTFYLRVEGDSMINAGIHSGDLLVVDRSIPATHRKIVIAVLNGELTVKRLHVSAHQEIKLVPENEQYSEILITSEMAFEIWGVVTAVVRRLHDDI